MLTLGTHFDELDRKIRPPKERLEAARDLPPMVRDYLRQHEEFETVAPHSRIVGSYAQDLSVGDVKDVDILVRVDGHAEANEPQAKQLILDLKGALDGLPEALGFEGYAGVDIERARRSVHVYLVGRDFHFDLVPCIAPNGFEEPLYVPDRGFNKWIPSHPVGFVALLDGLNTAHGGKMKRLGRLFKHFRDYQMKNRRPKSYWLGALLVHHVQSTLDMSQPLALLFRDLLDALYKQYASLLGREDEATPNIPDPMLGHNISWNWGRSHFETFMRRVDDGRKWAAMATEVADREEAVAYWQKVFGEKYFPSDVTEAAKELAQAGLPGVATVLSSGRVSAWRPATGMSTLSGPTRFYGEKTD